jgi:hypothetical protein
MHLDEFADPEAYTLSADNAAEFFHLTNGRPMKVARLKSTASDSLLSSTSGNHIASDIVVPATAQTNLRDRNRTIPSRLAIIRQTIAAALDQSSSDGSSGHAMVATASPLFGTVR